MSGCRVRIHGRVQGVFFRNWTAAKARSLGLSGWVRNRLDGSVELVAYGEGEAVQALVEACRSGPPAALVERIDAETVEGEWPGSGFEVAPTE